VASIHSVGPSSCHGNIRSSKILLAGNHDASVWGHGLITLDMVNASGYRAPEVTDDRLVSQKADVYSFGVLLVELLTGRTPVIIQLEEGVNLPQWARSAIFEDRASEVLDVELLRLHTDGEKEGMLRLLLLAVHCCSEDAKLRPTMSDVVQRIEEMYANLRPSTMSHA
jgi:serine/threonine protein kinase